MARMAQSGGKALDVGCGQGRDAIMLARHGYEVVGIDSSSIGIEQMVSKAKEVGRPVTGIVADFYEYDFQDQYAAIVLDSILHFQKSDLKKELALLDRLLEHLEEGGYFFIFVHQSTQKEKVLNEWVAKQGGKLETVVADYIDYVYEEKASDFRSEFQMFMIVLQRQGEHAFGIAP